VVQLKVLWINDNGRLRAQIERAGAMAVLPKPCDSDELTRLVRTALAAGRQH
jgi:DNA-binding NarL/FixJ family response regulator